MKFVLICLLILLCFSCICAQIDTAAVRRQHHSAFARDMSHGKRNDRLFPQPKISAPARDARVPLQIRVNSGYNATQQAIELELRKSDRIEFAQVWPELIRAWEHIEDTKRDESKGQLCKSNQIMPGRWVYSDRGLKVTNNDITINSSSHSFYCCDKPVPTGYSRDDEKHCGYPNMKYDPRLSFRGSKEFNIADPDSCHCDSTTPKYRRTASDR